MTSSAEAVWESIADAGMWGIVGERAARGAQRYDLGAPHPDAVTIEQAVAKLPDTVIDWELEAEAILGDLLALIEPRAIEVVGELPPERRSTVVSWPRGGGGRNAARLSPPRSIIAVRTLRTNALVVMHASMGTRPDWHEDPPVPEPVPAPRGPGCAIVGECRRKGWYSDGSYCPLRYWPSPISIAQARADYLAWWRGLARLAEELTLVAHWPMMPAVPEMPWHLTTDGEYLTSRKQSNCA